MAKQIIIIIHQAWQVGKSHGTRAQTKSKAKKAKKVVLVLVVCA